MEINVRILSEMYDQNKVLKGDKIEILSNGKRYIIKEGKSGELYINTDERIIVYPHVANAITIDNKRSEI